MFENPLTLAAAVFIIVAIVGVIVEVLSWSDGFFEPTASGLLKAAGATLLRAFGLAAVVFLVATVVNGSSYKVAVGSECNAVLPRTYTLLKNEKGYVIRLGNPELNHYLRFSATGEIQRLPYDYKHPTYFKDSCKAKAFALEYFYDKNPNFAPANAP